MLAAAMCPLLALAQQRGMPRVAVLALEIPIVLLSAGDPLGTGLVTNLARPGGNVTGMGGGGVATSAKTFEILREILPSLKRAALLLNSADAAFGKSLLGQVEMARAVCLSKHGPYGQRATRSSTRRSARWRRIACRPSSSTRVCLTGW